MTGGVVLLLVFLSTIESAYESLSEVSLRILSSEREDSPRRFRFLRELMEHRRTEDLFLNPENPKTAEYIEGRYG